MSDIELVRATFTHSTHVYCLAVYKMLISWWLCLIISLLPLQAKVQALHVAKKFYTKPELSLKIEAS